MSRNAVEVEGQIGWVRSSDRLTRLEAGELKRPQHRTGQHHTNGQPVSGGLHCLPACLPLPPPPVPSMPSAPHDKKDDGRRSDLAVPITTDKVNFLDASCSTVLAGLVFAMRSGESRNSDP